MEFWLSKGTPPTSGDFALAKQLQDEENRRGESVSSSTTTADVGTNDAADYMAPYQHKAVLFATYQDGEKGKWELNPECRSLLGNINKELCVVGIAGTHNLLYLTLSHISPYHEDLSTCMCSALCSLLSSR